jgi:hypothetical protein
MSEVRGERRANGSVDKFPASLMREADEPGRWQAWRGASRARTTPNGRTTIRLFGPTRFHAGPKLHLSGIRENNFMSHTPRVKICAAAARLFLQVRLQDASLPWISKDETLLFVQLSLS